MDQHVKKRPVSRQSAHRPHAARAHVSWLARPPDPSTLAGTHEERLVAVRRIRDDIRHRVSQWCRLACTNA